MESVAVAFAYRPKAILAVLTAGILSDQRKFARRRQNRCRGRAASWLGLIPLEFHMGMLRLKRRPRKLLGHHRRRPSRFAITDNGSGRAVCGFWASSL